LFRTRSGRYFLYGDGEASSPYSKPYGGNGRCGAEEIVPLTDNEARKWLEQFDDPDELCPELFADAVEIEPSESVIYLRVPTFLKGQLENLASQEGESLNTFLIKVLEFKSQVQSAEAI
jgi:hypothetical protein